MKKALYLLALAALPVFAHAQDASKNKEADKQKITAKCMEDAKDQLAGASEAQQATFKEFCSCMGENLSKEYTYEQYEALEKDMDGADDAKKQEVSQKLLPLIMPCMEEMQKKMGGE